MNEEERFLFDLRGYLVLPQVLEAETVRQMNAWIDAQAERDPHWRGQTANKHVENPITWHPLFQNLMDHPRVLPILREILGDRFRLDHDYAIFLEPGHKGLKLHGPHTVPFDPCHYYRCDNGQIRCGLTVVAWSLTDVPPGAGGFAVVAGSHKSNFPCPPDIKTLERSSPIVEQIPCKAGDCVIFTEALLHGTLPWKGPGTRRTLFYKYAPCMLAWSQQTYSAPEQVPFPPHFWENLTPRQKLLLAPASAIDFHPPIES
jgi:ectoine hydroxylase-related dioxygenase (phytanoyl-CoA dioxygenase family)